MFGLLLLSLACHPGCGGASSGGSDGPPVPLVTGPKPDVVLITLDTTRADRIGAYGYAGARTPTIDKLANEGIRFDNAISPIPLTIPAHASLFTGLLPFHHGIRSNGDNLLQPSFTTLAEMLSAEGWTTAASVAAFVTTRQWGFSQGFSAYFDEMPEATNGDRNYWHTERSGDKVVDDALGWLSAQPENEPVFLWVHLYDAHGPHVAKGRYADELKDRPYDAQLSFVDDQVARLVDAFAGRNVLWCLVGDHGESLGDHHELTHGMYNYQATQHVPWILSGAGVTSGVVKDTVSTVDLTPTLLRTLGLAVPQGLDGVPEPGTPTFAYSETYQLAERYRLAPHRTITSGNLKLIATPKPELYDILQDPGEKTNLAADHTDDVKRLQGLLDGLNATPPSATAAPMDAATVSQLAALGYVSGGGDAGVDPLSLPDPKDYESFLEDAAKLDDPDARPTPDETLALLDSLLARKPDAFEVRMRRIPLLMRMGRADEARQFVDETAKMFPDRGRVWVMLAGMARQDGDLELALTHAKKAIEVEPDQPASYEAEVETLFAMGRTDEAVAEGEKAMQLNPRNFGVAALLGQHFLSKHDFPTAERYLRVAVAGPNPRRAARVQLAILAIGANARQDAYKLLNAEIKDYPGNVLARRMLARLYGEDQRWLEQKEQLVALYRGAQQDPEILRAYAQCLFNLGDYVGARRVMEDGLIYAPDDPDMLLLDANLLAKEGKREEGLKVYERAKALNEKRIEAAKAAAGSAPKPKGGKPGKGGGK